MCYLVPPVRVRYWLSFRENIRSSDPAMKSKSKSKKTRTRSKTQAKPKTHRTTRATTTPRTMSTPNPYTSPDFKLCEEIEVGDIGGFGVTSEGRMERETRCTQRATQFCKNCERNLCSTHYDLLHKDHDSVVKLGSGPNPVQL